MVCDITGTAEPVAGVADKPVFDTIGRLVETHHHADARWWLIEIRALYRADLPDGSEIVLSDMTITIS